MKRAFAWSRKIDFINSQVVQRRCQAVMCKDPGPRFILADCSVGRLCSQNWGF